MENSDKTNGEGYTMWARKTLDSDIFCNKPDSWFKIWFYIVSKANHKENGKFKRGQCFLKYEWIMEKTGATKDQVKHCVEYMKHATQIATQKSTRGFIITVVNYDYYQDNTNYQGKKPSLKATLKGTEKPHESHTINKNDKNDKNKDIATGVADQPLIPLKEEEPMKLEQFVTSMRSSPLRYIRLIGEYADEIKPQFTTKSQWKVFTTRNVRPAKQLEPFTDEQIEKALTHIEKNKKSVKNPRGFITEWTLETLLKYITK